MMNRDKQVWRQREERDFYVAIGSWENERYQERCRRRKMPPAQRTREGIPTVEM